MKHKKALLLTRDQLPEFTYLTVAYTIIMLVLAFLVIAGLGRTLADGFVSGDGWGFLGMLAVAAASAYHDTQVNTERRANGEWE